MARIIDFPHSPHRQAPGGNAPDGRANKARRQPCADELLRAVNQFPDLYSALRPRELTWGEEIADDWRSFIAEVRGSPCSHALVAIAAVIGWTVLLVAPTLWGAWS